MMGEKKFESQEVERGSNRTYDLDCDRTCDLSSDKTCNPVGERTYDPVSHRTCDLGSDRTCDKICDLDSDTPCDLVRLDLNANLITTNDKQLLQVYYESRKECKER